MRFVHIADVHLDTAFAGRSAELRRRLRDACREALGRAADLAVDHRVHAFLIAGDLFDAELLSLQTEGFLVDQARRLADAGITMIYATGNHDPSAGGVRSFVWPSNVTEVGSADPVTVEIRDDGGRLLGRVTAAGHETSRVTENLASRFPPPRGDVPEVALLHTQVRGSPASEEHGPYAPSELAALRSSGYDYWALGHVHRPQALSDSPPIRYSGNVQGRTPAETGARGGLLVDLSDRSAPRISFHPLGPVRWEHVRISGLEEARTHGQLLTAVTDAWSTHRSGQAIAPGTESVVVVDLQGSSPLWERFREEEEDLEGLEEDLAARWGVLAVELRTGSLRPVASPERHQERQDVLGEVLRLLRAVRSGDESIPGLDPGQLGGLERAGASSPQAYVSELLEGAEGEILARFLRGPPEGGDRR